MQRYVLPLPYTSAYPPQNIVYLTVNLPDIQESSLVSDLQPTFLDFKATAGAAKEYAFRLDFFEEIVPEVRLCRRSPFCL